eukprot:g8179.t1
MSHGLSDFERGESSANSTKEEVFRYLHGVNSNLKLLAQLLAKQEMSYAAELNRVKSNWEGEVGDLREQMQQKEAEKTRQVRELAHAKQTLGTVVGKERMAERQFATSERMRGTMAYRAEQLLAEQQLLRSRLKDLRSKDFVRENASLKGKLAAAERERDRLRASSVAVVHEEAKLVEENHQKAQCPELKSKFEKLFEEHNRLQLEHDAVLQQKTTCLQQLEAPADPEDAMEKRHVGGKRVVDKDEFAKMVQSYVKMQSREVLEDVITQKLMRDFEKHKEHESGSAAKVKVKRNHRAKGGASVNKNHKHKRPLHQKNTKKQASRKNAGESVGMQSDEGLVAKLVARKKQALHNLLHRDFLEGAGAGENDADFVAVDKWVR